MTLDGSEDDEDETPLECSACGGPLVVLGTLGRLEHFRCRNCGLERSRDTKPVNPT